MASAGRDLKLKCDAILAQERRWAVAVARSFSQPRPISVWEVMIPVLLIFNYARSRNARDVMVQNLLFTKRLALDGACEILDRGKTRHAVVEAFEERTRELLDTVQGGLYSQAIRDRQLAEMQLLLDHYLALLQAEGQRVEDLTRNAYGTLERYQAFLGKLEEAEGEVNRAALSTLEQPAATERVTRMESVLRHVRTSWAEAVFKEDRS